MSFALAKNTQISAKLDQKEKKNLKLFLERYCKSRKCNTHTYRGRLNVGRITSE